MTTELKIQIVFAVILAFELLGLFMIVVRTVANLEYGFNRAEEIIAREVKLSLRHKEAEKASVAKMEQVESKNKKNELLLNIPFMERLSKEKRSGG
jgi:hypothetical protein